MTCSDCGAGQPACPSCSQGWLVERKGRYGAFLGCVRFPDCNGKLKVPNARCRQETY
ncbi:topoisomerase DNA-binding C4 zinc finger domain-containing protein [Pararhodobacter oceanensis]|uniref:topoisomerase DNA-binding C4 zinc finger domain-containing protein n=1 Tax=Pararhodobacter oceanensis TaxID=2172121 RepID=UPI003A928F77